jgi:hypothetical protein
MTERFAEVLAALEQPPARPRAKMLVLDVVVRWTSNLPLDRLTLRRPLLAGTATRVALVAATVQQGSAVARTLWLHDLVGRHAVAGCCYCGPATSAGDGSRFPTGLAIPSVARIWTKVTAC